MKQRRLAALAVLALAGAAIGVGMAAGRPSDDRRDLMISSTDPLPLEQLVGRVVIARFDGARLPRHLRTALWRGRAAGVILFRDNVRSAAQVRRLTGSIQRAAHQTALICTDEEGGAIRILPFAGSAVGQASQATPAEAAAAARETVSDLKREGVNVNLAPVADVATASSFMRDRSFSGEAASVAARVAAAVRTYRRTGVASTVKHFPGLGRATVNTDFASSVVRASRAELERDLAPFRAAVAADVPFVMAAHASYPAYGRAIASQSRVLITDVLKGELGFRGAVITDSLEAQAVLDRSSIEKAAVRSIRAGADIVLTTGSGGYARVYRALLREARRSPAFRTRVEDAFGRVLRARASAGLPVPTD